MKTIINVILAIGLALFLFLWLNARSNLNETSQLLKTSQDQLALSKNTNNDCQKQLATAKNSLSDSQDETTKISESLTAKDNELRRLKDSSSSLTREVNLLQAQIDGLTADKLAVENLKTENESYIKLVSELTASLAVTAQERDLFLNQRDEARKTLELYRTN
jgi:chromosome segregation ATPase